MTREIGSGGPPEGRFALRLFEMGEVCYIHSKIINSNLFRHTRQMEYVRFFVVLEIACKARRYNCLLMSTTKCNI